MDGRGERKTRGPRYGTSAIWRFVPLIVLQLVDFSSLSLGMLISRWQIYIFRSSRVSLDLNPEDSAFTVISDVQLVSSSYLNCGNLKKKQLRKVASFAATCTHLRCLRTNNSLYSSILLIRFWIQAQFSAKYYKNIDISSRITL